MSRVSVIVACAGLECLVPAGVVFGASGGAGEGSAGSAGSSGALTLDASAAALGEVRQPFGVRPVGGTTDGPWRAPDWLTLSYGHAADGDEGTHHQLAIAPSWFVADTLEFGVELSGWYFDQESRGTGAGAKVEDDSTFGASFRFMARWHLLGGTYGDAPVGAKDLDWTLFIEGGIGVLLSSGEVPSDGTRLNFLPTGGLGGTLRISEGGTRLVGGVRLHHVSNARTNSDRKNPDFNAPQLYLGVSWAF